MLFTPIPCRLSSVILSSFAMVQIYNLFFDFTRLLTIIFERQVKHFCLTVQWSERQIVMQLKKYKVFFVFW